LRLEEEGGWGDDEERGEEGDSVGKKRCLDMLDVCSEI
jgi:hypothetical protein